MILKMVRNYGSNEDPPPEMVVECDRYMLHPCIEGDGIDENAIYFFNDGRKEWKPTTVIVAFQEGKDPKQLLLAEVNVYVMNNDGKTVDRIYA